MGRGRDTVPGVGGRGHGEAWSGRLRGRLAPAITRKGDAGATADAVLARGTLDGEGARRRALATQAALGKREQRVLVAAVLPGSSLKVALNGQIRVVVVSQRALGLGRWGRVLDLEGARRRVDGVPETRGGLARRALVQRAQVEVEDAVRQRPAGRHWRRSRRRVSSGGRAWSRRRDGGERAVVGGGGGEFLRGPKGKWSMLTAALGLQRRPGRGTEQR